MGEQEIAGPSVHICDECIGLCDDIIAEEVDRDVEDEPELLQRTRREIDPAHPSRYLPAPT